jgi:N-methylhydantoinase B
MAVEQQLSPVLLEILRGAFQSVANEMAAAVELAAYSLVITEGRDFSGSLYDTAGFLVAQGHEDLPIHVGTTQHTVQAVMEGIGVGRMREGDIYIMNDPFLGGTHVNDVRLVMPIFYGGQVVAFVATTAHWTDVGGMVPGSFCQEGRECYQEGLRITPSTIVEEGELNVQLARLISANVRLPYESQGDLRAQIAACRAGERRVRELVEKYGIDVIRSGMSELQNHSERVFRAEIARLPDGEYCWEEYVDEDFYTGEPKAIRLRLVVHGDDLTYDLSGSDSIALSSINSPFSATFSAVLITAKAIFSEIPMNAGIMRAIKIVTRPNTIVHAEPPVAVGGCGATSWEKTCCACLCVFSKIAPDRTIAGSYNLINTYFGGLNPLTARSYICYVWSEGGTGATARGDGPSAMQSFFNSSTQNLPVELLERGAPILIESYELRNNTAGAGKHRGGFGTRRSIRLVETDAILSMTGDRRKFPAPGLLGGLPSSTQTVLLQKEDGTIEELGVCVSNQPVRRGECVIIESMGGGGYGDPLERDPALVLNDVVNEYITADDALAQYGVTVHEIDREALLFELDWEATTQEREKRREHPPRPAPGQGAQ